MHSRAIRRTRKEEDDESYFISMADMMVGLLFIFLILVLYFAMAFRQTTDQLSGANDARKHILETLKERLDERFKPLGLTVTINPETGVLSLPNSILFATGQYSLSPQGKQAVGIVARELALVLPCYADHRPGVKLERRCKPSHHRIDAIFVEGHTDSVPLNRAGIISDNLDLSTLRATHTFRQLVASAPELNLLTNNAGSRPVPILSVSGYGDQRLVEEGVGEEVNKHNRRIDLRFLMISPSSDLGDRNSKDMQGAS